MQNILCSAAPQSTAHIWAADVPSAKKRLLLLLLRFCMRAWMLMCVIERRCVSIFTQHALVLYIEATHTCVYVYNQMGCSRSGSSAGGTRGEKLHRARYNHPLRAGFCLEGRGGLDTYEGRGADPGHWKNKHTGGRRCSDHYIHPVLKGRNGKKHINKHKRLIKCRAAR